MEAAKNSNQVQVEQLYNVFWKKGRIAATHLPLKSSTLTSHVLSASGSSKCTRLPPALVEMESSGGTLRQAGRQMSLLEMSHPAWAELYPQSTQGRFLGR